MAVLVLGLGLLTACTSNDNPLDGDGSAIKGSTYMSVAINLATSNSTRADNQEDETGNPNYNFVGKWGGKDKINAVGVYVFDAASKLEVYKEFVTGEFQLQGVASDKSVTITPSKGIKVKPGEKTVYVVVNPTTETKAFLPSAEGTALTVFEDKYKSVGTVAANPDHFLSINGEGSATVAVKTSAEKLAYVDGSDNTDIITMTVIKPATSVDVKENISEAATLAGDATNRAKLSVKRAVARVMITTTKAQFDVIGDDPLTSAVETNAVLGTVSKIKYVVAQGEKTFHFMQKAGGSAELTYATPYSSFIPGSSDYTWPNAGSKYDYSGLWKGYVANAISGTEVPTNTLYHTTAGTALNNITANLVAKLNGAFILPNTHKWGATLDVSDYRKGNTAYVLVRAEFHPKKVVEENGNINEAWPAGKTFYMGANGVFYASVKAAREAKKDGKPLGVAKQTAAKYENGKTLYYAWVNPDHTDDGKWINSPVNRNNIYHIEISGFKRIGTNWNPLVPGDPNNLSENPNNPDPKPRDEDPNDPNEPKDPPVRPEDPLTPKETWMSVQTKILPWNVHSYSVELGI